VLRRWDLPESCDWGNKASWCPGILDDQCADAMVAGKCLYFVCFYCGPSGICLQPLSEKDRPVFQNTPVR